MIIDAVYFSRARQQLVSTVNWYIDIQNWAKFVLHMKSHSGVRWPSIQVLCLIISWTWIALLIIWNKVAGRIYIHIHSARCAMDILGLQKREYISVLTRARSARGRADIYSRFWWPNVSIATRAELYMVYIHDVLIFCQDPSLWGCSIMFIS